MNPLDLKTPQEWDKILDRFARQIRMTTCLTDEAGNQLLCRFDRCPLCAAIRSDQAATTFICSQTNTAMLAVVKKTLKPEIDLCEAGLLRLVVPVVRDRSLVGQVTACGLAPEDEELDPFLIARQRGISEERVLELARATPLSSGDLLQPPAENLFREING